MSMNDTPRGERVHIAFFGRTNAGKSSVMNAFTGQTLSVVSNVKGTTTDPVWKTMELLPLGPVSLIDTPGIDDEGELGKLRVKKAREILSRTDVAVLVADAATGIDEPEQQLIALFAENDIPYVVALNKVDVATPSVIDPHTICVSAKTGEGIHELKERVARLPRPEGTGLKLVGDLVSPGDIAVLVTPIDSAAPKGRLILPQQQAIRDLLDVGALAVVTREHELTNALAALKAPPAMVITDSQAFAVVAEQTPESVPLTSFSILMARYKGLLDTAVRGAKAISALSAGDTVLICEGCTHHRQCDDIGSVKLPRWLQAYTGCELRFEFTSGASFPEDVSPYKLIIHCGGCMLNERTVQSRMKEAARQHVPMTNYGVAIAYMQGILKRSLSLFPHLLQVLEADEA